MDNQGKLKFTKLAKEEVDDVVLDYLCANGGLTKVNVRTMHDKVKEGVWTVWRLPAEAEGYAVSYPDCGKLFIYYLHGSGLFAKLNVEDLLAVARSEGLQGVAAETMQVGMKKILRKIGFRVVAEGPYGWVMELEDGRRRSDQSNEQHV